LIFAEVTVVPVNKRGVLQVEDVLSAVKPNTVLITIMMANNETGVTMPVAEIGRLVMLLQN